MLQVPAVNFFFVSVTLSRISLGQLFLLWPPPSVFMARVFFLGGNSRHSGEDETMISDKQDLRIVTRQKLVVSELVDGQSACLIWKHVCYSWSYTVGSTPEGYAGCNPRFRCQDSHTCVSFDASFSKWYNRGSEKWSQGNLCLNYGKVNLVQEMSHKIWTCVPYLQRGDFKSRAIVFWATVLKTAALRSWPK